MSKTLSSSQTTYDALVGGSLADRPGTRQGLARLQAALEAEPAAQAARVALVMAAEQASDPVERRQARRDLPAALEAVYRAQDELALARRGHTEDLEREFADVAPIIQTQHDVRMAQLEAGLRDVLALAQAVVDVERVADAYALTGSSCGGGRRAVVSAPGGFVHGWLKNWLQMPAFTRS